MKKARAVLFSSYLDGAEDLNPRTHPDLLKAHEPEMVSVPEREKIMTMTNRGSLAPQRGEGSRVRGETAQIVEVQIHRLFLLARRREE
jgi:hypothetical protein